MANFPSDMRPQGVMVIFITLDWIFVLMNTATMIPCWRVSMRKLVIGLHSLNSLISGSSSELLSSNLK